MRVIIHAGGLSLDNGAYAPLTQYFDLAKAVGVEAETGHYYGDDALEVPDSDWPTVEAMLIEAKMLYRIPGRHAEWQNVQTDRVRQLVSRPHNQ